MALAGVEAVILRAGLVDAADALFQLAVAEAVAVLALGAAAGDLVGHVGVDVDAERLVVGQDVVRAAADDHAVGLLCQLVQNFRLRGEDAAVDRVDGVLRRGGHGDGDRDGVVGVDLVLHDLIHVVLRQLAALGDGGDDLLVIVGEAELLCEALADLAAAGAEFPADGDDTIHEVSPLHGFIAKTAES